MAILDSDPQRITGLSLLLTKLEANGWTFNKMVRGAPPYALGGPKYFYSSSNSISLDYLKCLDGFSEIGVEQLHHEKRVARSSLLVISEAPLQC